MKWNIVSWILTTGFGVLSAWLSRVAKHNKDKADLLTPVIQGVEAAGNQLTKTAIETAATRAGVESRLNVEVKKLTR